MIPKIMYDGMNFTMHPVEPSYLLSTSSPSCSSGLQPALRPPHSNGVLLSTTHSRCSQTNSHPQLQPLIRIRDSLRRETLHGDKRLRIKILELRKTHDGREKGEEEKVWLQVGTFIFAVCYSWRVLPLFVFHRWWIQQLKELKDKSRSQGGTQLFVDSKSYYQYYVWGGNKGTIILTLILCLTLQHTGKSQQLLMTENRVRNVAAALNRVAWLQQSLLGGSDHLYKEDVNTLGSIEWDPQCSSYWRVTRRIQQPLRRMKSHLFPPSLPNCSLQFLS